ncbi:MAG: integrin alpha [Planctomycetota bacterium]
MQSWKLIRRSVLVIALVTLTSTLAVGQVLSPPPDQVYFGDTCDDLFGYAVALGDDWNADGSPDLIVGMPFDEYQGTTPGGVQLLSLKDGRVIRTLYGDGIYGAGFGVSVCSAGDLDGDGLDEIAVGAPWDRQVKLINGKVWIFRGSDGQLFRTHAGDTPYEQFGLSLANLGDLDGDGLDDLAVGAPGESWGGLYSGSVYVLSGRDGSTIHRFDGDSAFDYLGRSVAAAGDVDRDGVPDILMGAPGDDAGGVPGAGVALVCSGVDGSVLHRVEGTSIGGQLGHVVVGPGDLDRDGHADFLVGALTSDEAGPFSGSVWVYSGRRGRLRYRVDGVAAREHFGWAATGAGDVDGDGFRDLLVTSGGGSFTQLSPARLMFLSGVDGRVIRELRTRTIGPWIGRVFMTIGYSVAGVGDVEGDGFDDVVVGFPKDPLNPSGGGSVIRLSGEDLR